MVWYRKIVLNTCYIDALSELAKVQRNQDPSIKTSPGEFVFFKSIANRHRRSIFTFCFEGKIVEENSCVLLEYKASPSLSVHISAIALCIPLISGVRNLCMGAGSVAFIVIGLFINMLFWLLVYGQVHECIKDFEKRFQVDS